MNGEILGVMSKNRWEEVQVRGMEHEGRDYLDIRVFKLTEDGRGGADGLPTGKGVTIRLDRLPDLIQALREVEPYLAAKQAAEEERRAMSSRPSALDVDRRSSRYRRWGEDRDSNWG